MTELTNADRFRRMADRIEHNDDSPFAGACVIIPPAIGGNPIEFMLLDQSVDPAQFWSAIATKVKFELEHAEAERRRIMGSIR